MLPSNSKSIHSPHFSFLNWIVFFFLVHSANCN